MRGEGARGGRGGRERGQRGERGEECEWNYCSDGSFLKLRRS